MRQPERAQEEQQHGNAPSVVDQPRVSAFRQDLAAARQGNCQDSAAQVVRASQQEGHAREDLYLELEVPEVSAGVPVGLGPVAVRVAVQQGAQVAQEEGVAPPPHHALPRALEPLHAEPRVRVVVHVVGHAGEHVDVDPGPEEAHGQLPRILVHGALEASPQPVRPRREDRSSASLLISLAALVAPCAQVDGEEHERVLHQDQGAHRCEDRVLLLESVDVAPLGALRHVQEEQRGGQADAQPTQPCRVLRAGRGQRSEVVPQGEGPDEELLLGSWRLARHGRGAPGQAPASSASSAHLAEARCDQRRQQQEGQAPVQRRPEVVRDRQPVPVLLEGEHVLHARLWVEGAVIAVVRVMLEEVLVHRWQDLVSHGYFVTCAWNAGAEVRCSGSCSPMVVDKEHKEEAVALAEANGWIAVPLQDVPLQVLPHKTAQFFEAARSSLIRVHARTTTLFPLLGGAYM
mmetsp:Transcript_1611/g.3201  ORF Transcript_1611/g.3201 Transcript_1611/m.3201 type:complete len:460 (+) Transcript_1611:485-1864(+)